MSLKELSATFHIPSRRPVEWQLLDGTPVKVGDIIRVQDDYGLKFGRIDTICDSPYWNERGVMCAYIVNLEKEPCFAGYLTVVAR